MDKTPNIVMIWPTSLVSLLASLLFTWCVWEFLVSGTAFECMDDGIDIGFWMSADTHRSAGDKVLPGWTWEKVEAVNGVFRLGFLTLWVGASFVSFRVLKSILRENSDGADNHNLPVPTPTSRTSRVAVDLRPET